MMHAVNASPSAVHFYELHFGRVLSNIKDKESQLETSSIYRKVYCSSSLKAFYLSCKHGSDTLKSFCKRTEH